MVAKVGDKRVVQSGTIIGHDALGLFLFTLGPVGIGIQFLNDRSHRFSTRIEADEDSALLVFMNANGPLDFNDFELTFEGQTVHLLVMVHSTGPIGNAARQISYTLLTDKNGAHE